MKRQNRYDLKPEEINWSTRFLLSARLGTGFLALALFSLLGILWLNRQSPFRGEHWGLLYQIVTAEGWRELFHKVAHFNCFGDTRLQPFAFFPVALAYLFLKHHYSLHLFLSLLIHLGIGTCALVLLDGIRTQFSTPWRSLFTKYGIELALFLVLFPSIDVLMWTFFHYILWATLFALLSIILFLKNMNHLNKQKGLAYLLAVVATLFYEPFFGVLALYFAFDLIYRAKKLHFLIPLMLCLGIGFTFLERVPDRVTHLEPVVGHFLGRALHTGHDVLLGTPFAENKIFFCIYNFVLVVLNILRAIFFLSAVHKVNIYEFPNAFGLRGIPLAWVTLFSTFLGLGALWILFIRRYERLLFVSVLPVALFTIIAAGRTLDGNFPAVQLRYAYILLPFLWVILCQLFFYYAPSRVYYIAALGILFFMNAGSGLDLGARLSYDMGEFARFVRQIQEEGNDSSETVRKVAQALADVQVPTRQDNLFFTYNGRGAILSYVAAHWEPEAVKKPYID